MNDRKLAELFHVKPGRKVSLAKRPTAWAGTPEMRELKGDELKNRAQEYIREKKRKLTEAQEMLWASDTHSVLVILQAMDAAGKDGVIKHVMSGLNPQGCHVHSFKQPSAEELDHTFLWRAMKAVPERGKIVIFNRSHYEDVLIVKVHPEILERSKLPDGKRDGKFWKHRYDDINAFEHHLARNGTLVLKFFLHVSKGEQKRRFLERLDTPEKHWKFSLSDLSERGFWKQYQRAYEDALRATSTPWAPWYVVPADNKWISRAIVAHVMAWSIRSLDLRFPSSSPEYRRLLAQAKRKLLAE